MMNLRPTIFRRHQQKLARRPRHRNDSSAGVLLLPGSTTSRFRTVCTMRAIFRPSACADAAGRCLYVERRPLEAPPYPVLCRPSVHGRLQRVNLCWEYALVASRVAARPGAWCAPISPDASCLSHRLPLIAGGREHDGHICVLHCCNGDVVDRHF